MKKETIIYALFEFVSLLTSDATVTYDNTILKVLFTKMSNNRLKIQDGKLIFDAIFDVVSPNLLQN